MIFAIRTGLAEALAVQGFPVAVSIGPDRPMAVGVSRQSHRVVIDYDRSSGDSFRAPVGSKSNPNRVLANFVGYTITIYASDFSAGALPWEHDIELYRVLDGVLVALHDWVQSTGAVLELTSGRLLSWEEMGGAATGDSWPVSGYALSVRVGRSIDRKKYDGSARGTAAIGSFDTTTRVTRAGVTYEEID